MRDLDALQADGAQESPPRPLTRNEAAERLRASFEPHEALWVKGLLDEALAEERRATVERIRERFNHARIDRDADVFAILDEEAPR